MNGVDASTGKRLAGTAHLAQSIGDIVMTPIGSRVMREDYGSLLPELIDQPFNGTTKLRMCGAIAAALQKWEPRIRLTRVGLTAGVEAGALTLEVEGQLTEPVATSEYTRMTIPLT